MSRSVTILGSTGSIGDSALKVIRSYPEELSVYALSTHWNLEKLHEQVEDFHPTAVSVMDEEAASTFRERHPELQVLVGLDGLCELAAMECDVVLCGVVGSVGLRPILSAIESGNRIALANKEPMVMAGPQNPNFEVTFAVEACAEFVLDTSLPTESHPFSSKLARSRSYSSSREPMLVPIATATRFGS